MDVWRENPTIENQVESLVGSVDDLEFTDHFSVLMRWMDQVADRKLKGVFYTPKPLASYVVRAALNGLAATGTKIDEIAILEPAVGAGVFINALLDELPEKNLASQVLSHLTCIDISPSAIIIAQALLAKRIRAESEVVIENFPCFYAGDTLTCDPHPIYSELELDPPDLNLHLRKKNYQLIVGNPPFGSMTGPTSDWIKRLLHGQATGKAGQVSYFEVDGSQLGERKSWLHDNYVKFTRYAHWQIDRSEAGCLALVLNSGFLDNLSFRGMRFQLQNSFAHLETVDFGGDSRNVLDTTVTDENLFEIETGVATLIGFKSHTSEKASQHHVRLRGSRKAKLDWCRTQETTGLDCRNEFPKATSPDFRFGEQSNELDLEYSHGISLEELFQKHFSIPVTARDHLVIYWGRKGLERRIERFLDPTKPDSEVRREFFPRPRSTRYPQGDSRSWKLTDIRKFWQSQDWRKWIRRCSYRPFDDRFILWHPSAIDWPRMEFANSFQIPGNACLIARRQAPPHLPYTYVWSTQSIPIDGIIRSDNRGNEYCFPLFCLDDDRVQENIPKNHLRSLAKHWNTPIDSTLVFRFVLALLHSTEYRTRYQAQLCRSFPRIFFPTSLVITQQLADAGQHLLKAQAGLVATEQETELPKHSPDQDISPTLSRSGELRFANKKSLKFSTEMWEFTVGSYHVLRKYCKNRFRSQCYQGLKQDVNLLQARIKKQIELQARIDKIISAAGGFSKVFETNQENHVKPI